MINGIMFQYFEWYLPDDGSLWNQLREDAPNLAEKGVTAVWIPPCYKGTGSSDVGYGVYDLFDLGEFDQKGTVRTKYGTRAELRAAIDALHEYGIYVYADVVLNHKAGADQTETFKAVKVDPNDRTRDLEPARDIKGWTCFTFPGRTDKERSAFEWHFQHFTGVDYDEAKKEKAIFRIIGDNKHWARKVSDENGNFDYLMFADIDHSHPDVRKELLHWGHWFVTELNLDGFRLDAVKHISADFMEDFAGHMRESFGEDFYLVGEYWQADPAETGEYIAETAWQINLFDVALHFNFMRISQNKAGFDLRKIFDGTIVAKDPFHAVTFVENHDSQPGQALESSVEQWFKESAYALILLRKDGYPCVFYGDYYGSGGNRPLASHKVKLDKMLLLRRHYSLGEQIDYFEAPDLIGWKRSGSKKNPEPMIVLVSAADDERTMRVEVGKEYTGETFADFLGNHDGKIVIDEDGFGEFPVHPCKTSAWLQDGLPLDDYDLDEIESVD